MTASASSMVAITSTGPQALGSTWASAMRAPGTPMMRAALT